MSFQQTTFILSTTDNKPLHLSYVMTYGAEERWVSMSEDLPPQGLENQGIGWLKVVNETFDTGKNCVITLAIDPVIVNKVPYASDKASLLFSVNGSNLHINIHKDGSMDTTGTYGNETVHFDSDLGKVGGKVSTIICKQR